MTEQDWKKFVALMEKEPEAWFKFLARCAELPGLVLTPAEVAILLRVPEEVVTTEAEAGRLPGRKLGAEWRFSRPAVVEWLQGERPGMSGPVSKSSKDRMLAAFGAWKDFGEDPEATIAELKRARKAASGTKG
jgi:excisionase family DNA binding protein